MIGLLLSVSASSASAAPSRTTLPATMVDPTVATLNGSVSAEGHRTDYGFGWGTTPDLQEWPNATQIKTTTSTTPIEVSEKITGLEMGTTYYFAIGTFDHVTQTVDYGRVLSSTTLSAAHSPQFLAAGYPARLWGWLGSGSILEVGEGILDVYGCTVYSLTGSHTEASASLTALPQLSGCTGRTAGNTGRATVKMNSYSYLFTIENSYYYNGNGKFAIACANEGDAIEYSFSNHNCVVKVAAQESSSRIDYYNEGPATNRRVTVQGDAAIKYTTNEKFVCFAAGLGASGDASIGLSDSTLQATTGVEALYSELYVGG